MKKQISSSSLFLLELILSILIFSTAAAVSVSLFAKAHTLTRDAAVADDAAISVQTLAEIIRGSKTPETLTANIRETFPDAVFSGDSSGTPVVTVFFDGERKPCKKSSAVWTMTADLSAEKTLLTASIRYEAFETAGKKDTDPVFSLRMEKALPDEQFFEDLRDLFGKEG